MYEKSIRKNLNNPDYEIEIEYGDAPLLYSNKGLFSETDIKNVIEYLVNLGEDINYCDPTSVNLLTISLLNNHQTTEIEEYIISKMDKNLINLRSYGFDEVDYKPITSLSIAYENRNHKIASLLLENGADLDIENGQEIIKFIRDYYWIPRRGFIIFT